MEETCLMQCPLCGEIYDRAHGTGKHTDCENILSAKRSWEDNCRKKNIPFDHCAVCGSKDDLTVDHIIPRARGGTNESGNLQVLCRFCNSKKGAR